MVHLNKTVALEKLCGLPDPNDDIFIHPALDLDDFSQNS